MKHAKWNLVRRIQVFFNFLAYHVNQYSNYVKIRHFVGMYCTTKYNIYKVVGIWYMNLIKMVIQSLHPSQYTYNALYLHNLETHWQQCVKGGGKIRMASPLYLFLLSMGKILASHR